MSEYLWGDCVKTEFFKCARERAEPHVRKYTGSLDPRSARIIFGTGPWPSRFIGINLKGKSKAFFNYPEGNDLICTDMYEKKRRAFHSLWRHFKARTVAIHAEIRRSECRAARTDLCMYWNI